MSPTAERDLFNTCRSIWRARIQPRFTSLKLGSQEWEDLEAVALERVFRKLDRFDIQRGAFSAWAMRVMQRSAWNELRSIIPNKKVPAHKWRTDLRMARPLRVVVKQTGVWGEETTVVEPDLMDETVKRDALEIEEFERTLDKNERRFFQFALAGLNMMEVQRFIKTRSYGQIVDAYRRLHLRFREYQQSV